MISKRLFSLVVIFLVNGWSTGGLLAQSDAGISELLEEIDTLNSITSGHTKEIDALKKRVRELEDAVDKLQMVTQKQALRQRLRALEKRLAALEDKAKKQERRGPSLKPKFEFRLRPQGEWNMRDYDKSRADKEFWYLQRLRLGLDLRASKRMGGVIVFQDSRAWGTEASTASNERNVDLYQGYLYLRDVLLDGLFLKAGRMVLSFGAERQVGAFGWDNVGRSFDGVDVGYHREKTIDLDVFATVVKDTGRIGGPNTDFFGLYASSDYLPFAVLDFYSFYLRNRKEGQQEDIVTLGARAVVKPVGGLRLEGEAAVQVGRRDQSDPTAAAPKARNVSHLATAYYASADYTFDVPLKPKVGVFFYSASGDANLTDHRSTAYRVLFPTGHILLGNMDLFQWQGVWDVGPLLEVKLPWTLRFGAAYHLFSLTSRGGVLERVLRNEVVAFPGTGDRFLGQELDVVLRWLPLEHFSMELGYSFFLPGKAVDQSKAYVRGDQERLVPTALGKDLANFLYLQSTVSF